MKVNGVDIPNNVLQVQSGTNITVDSTDNTRPIVNLTSPLTGIVISGLYTFADNASAGHLLQAHFIEQVQAF